MGTRKSLVLATAAAALLLLTLGIVYQIFRSPPSVFVDPSGFPTLGNASAPVQVVLFEDFRCSHCCAFSREIFPQIQSNYIAPGLIRYTIVPLAFLKGSKPIANAILAVYHISPSQFPPFLEQIIANCQSEEPLSEKALLKMAHNVGNINFPQFEECVETQCYYHELEKNLRLAYKLLGKDFGTPGLYVNGIATPTTSFRAVQAKIDAALREGRKP